MLIFTNRASGVINNGATVVAIYGSEGLPGKWIKGLAAVVAGVLTVTWSTNGSVQATHDLIDNLETNGCDETPQSDVLWTPCYQSGAAEFNRLATIDGSFAPGMPYSPAPVLPKVFYTTSASTPAPFSIETARGQLLSAKSNTFYADAIAALGVPNGTKLRIDCVVEVESYLTQDLTNPVSLTLQTYNSAGGGKNAATFYNQLAGKMNIPASATSAMILEATDQNGCPGDVYCNIDQGTGTPGDTLTVTFVKETYAATAIHS